VGKKLCFCGNKRGMLGWDISGDEYICSSCYKALSNACGIDVMQMPLYINLISSELAKGILDGNSEKLEEFRSLLNVESTEEHITTSHTLDSVVAMLEKVGVSDVYGTKKEIEELPNLLQDDEVILYATSGLLDADGVLDFFGVRDSTGATVLAVLTDRRTIFVDKGLLWGLKVADIPIDVINSVTCVKGLIFGSISITHGSRSFCIKNVDKNSAAIFSDKAREQMSVLKKTQKTDGQSQTVVSAKSPIEQVKELKELLDMDIITKEEFEKKKYELLEL